MHLQELVRISICRDRSCPIETVKKLRYHAASHRSVSTCIVGNHLMLPITLCTKLVCGIGCLLCVLHSVPVVMGVGAPLVARRAPKGPGKVARVPARARYQKGPGRVAG